MDSEEAKMLYHEVKRSHAQLVTSRKKVYFGNNIRNSKDNSKESWRVVHSLTKVTFVHDDFTRKINDEVL